MTRLGLVGDLHATWSPADITSLDDHGYDGLLFTGDLGDVLHRGVRPLAMAIGRLRTPAVVVPGNHDGPSPLGVLRQATGLPHPPGATRRLLRRTEQLQRWLGPVPLGGYGLHRFGDVTVVVGRPWSMGGVGRLDFAAALAERHGVATVSQSTDRLVGLLERAPGRHVVLLAHNGPAGLGAERDAPWAVPGRGDLGDPDLAQAIAVARARDVPLRAVVAGHVHHGRRRRWHQRQDGLDYVNAARVRRGWHVVMTVGDEGVAIEQGVA